MTRFRCGAAAAALAVLLAAPAFGADSVFIGKCATCHQPGAGGVVGTYPPLAGTIGSYVAIPAGREYLAHVVLFGMSGPIKSAGADYDGLMPPQGADLSDAEIAATLNDVLQSFNRERLPADFKPFTPDEIRAVRTMPRGPTDQVSERSALLERLEHAESREAVKP